MWLIGDDCGRIGGEMVAMFDDNILVDRQLEQHILGDNLRALTVYGLI